MSFVALVRRGPFCIFRFFFRNCHSKSDEFNLPIHFKYPTSKIIHDERKNGWKNHRRDDPKANFSRPTFPQRDREIQKSESDSNCVQMTLDNDIRSIPKKKSKSSEMFASQDLLEVEGKPVKNRTSVFNQVLLNRRKYNPRMKSKVVGDIIFGINPVSMALKVKRRSFYQLFVKQNSSENARISDIQAQAESMNVPVVTVDVGTLDAWASGRPHQGVCLDAGQLFFDKEMDESIGPSYVTEEPLRIFLDKIQDPMNLGAVLRSCYYFGIDRVFTVKDHTCRLTPIVSKASSGAMEMMNVYAVENPTEFFKRKIMEGWNVVGSASTDALHRGNLNPQKIVDLKDFVCPKPTILLVGNEGGGIDSELIRFCDRIVTISNCSGGSPDMMSLNVSVATGIILHHCISQLLPNLERDQSHETIIMPAVE